MTGSFLATSKSSDMKIGILQADSVLDQFQAKHGNYPGMITEVLGDAAGVMGVDVTVVTYDVEHGHYPESLDECDGYVITGSKKSVYDDEPWIGELMAFVRELHAAKKKTVGLCFGHQLIAEALGGKTLGAEVGWGVGIHDSRLIEQPWFVDEDADHYTLVVSHKDQVVRLPEGAQLIATSDFCPNSMYTIGDHTLAMQGHPEFKPEYSKDLMDMREDILGPKTYAQGVASLETPLMRDDVARWAVRFLQGS